MIFDDLDTRMRQFETYRDQYVLPEISIIVRLDGRHFTTLTRNPVHKFEAPFDDRFNGLMVGTVEHLMKNTGFDVIYGYTQSDEISLLLHVNDNTFNRKVRKIVSILSSEASSYFTLHFGSMATFDARVCELPTRELVQDYFEWRQLDATRNALNSWCYWTLRKDGFSATKATSMLSGVTVAEKNELLFQHGINFNDLPAWQKRGVGLYWHLVDHEGYNPITQQKVMAVRRRIKIDRELPFPEAYRKDVISPILINQ